jgi:hypothetical protein
MPKLILTVFAAALLPLCLAARVGESITFHSPDGKQTVMRSASGFGIIGVDGGEFTP